MEDKVDNRTNHRSNESDDDSISQGCVDTRNNPPCDKEDDCKQNPSKDKTNTICKNSKVEQWRKKHHQQPLKGRFEGFRVLKVSVLKRQRIQKSYKVEPKAAKTTNSSLFRQGRPALKDATTHHHKTKDVHKKGLI